MVTKKDPIGAGILCPFRRDGKGDFANGEGLPVLKSDVGELLGIIGPTVSQPGELPWDCGRGSRLLTLKHRHIHSEMVRATAEHMAGGVLRAYEPRVRVGPTRVISEGTTLKVTVSYVPLAYQNVPVQSVDINPIG